ncbi:hypothetical protein E2562_027719, partial [Oryza meyeriana var. granulata]
MLSHGSLCFPEIYGYVQNERLSETFANRRCGDNGMVQQYQVPAIWARRQSRQMVFLDLGKEFSKLPSGG